jgi:predicted N-formylglutamate amidohydrolase
MTHPPVRVDGPARSPILLIGDHASNHVPDDIDLGIRPGLLDEHIALDIGVAALGRALCVQLDCPGLLGGVSRLVLDLNREEDATGLVPLESDGHAIVGNIGADVVARLARFWHPYHNAVAGQIVKQRPSLLISLHSFTPQLATRPHEARPWQIGVLYNEDDRAARIAIPALTAAGVIVGDQLPYSGKLLNATMNRHGEANGIAYLGLEVRQDLIGDDDGVVLWAAILAPICRQVAARLA